MLIILHSMKHPEMTCGVALINRERFRRTFLDRCGCLMSFWPAATVIQAIATNRVAIAVASTSKGTAQDKNKKTCSCT